MSGFVAVIALADGKAALDEQADRLAEAYVAIRGGSGQQVGAGQRVRAYAFGGPDVNDGGVQRDGQAWVVTAGIVHHTRPLPAAELDELDGQFALLRYDAQADTVTLASDPFGMFGLFVAERDGLIYASTSALSLARHLRAVPSTVGLETFLLSGYHCGTRTNWEGIERVGRGEMIQVAPAGRRRSTYWRPEVDDGIRRLGISESVDRCIERALEAVRLSGSGHESLWCDLTGGYDTRLLVLLARAAGLSFMTSTAGRIEDEDAELARRIARTAGWDWSLIPRPEAWSHMLTDLLPDAVGWGDAALDALHLSLVLWGHQVKAERSRQVLNGGGGEHFWSYAWQHEYGRSGRAGHANLDRWVQMRMLRAVPTDVFARDPRPEVVADLRERMEPVIEPYLAEARAVQSDILYLHKCTGHFGAYSAAASAKVDVHLPFYTRESFTAAFSTNPRHRFGHRFYRRLIDRLDPTIAAIPTAKGGPAQPPRLSNLQAFTPYYLRLGEIGLNKVSERLLHRSFRRPPSLGDSDAAAARASAIGYVGGDVNHWRSLKLYRRQMLEGFLADAHRQDFPASDLLGRILTTELSLRAAGVGLE